MRRYEDLSGKTFGKLTVLGRSDKRGTRGKRTVPLWECRCDCGTVTYRATDSLKNRDVSMCQTCAAMYATTKARAKAGFEEGTQISRIRDISEASNNQSGIRGVYLDSKTGKYRARLKFRGKVYNLGTYASQEEAVRARRAGEEEIYGEFLSNHKKVRQGERLLRGGENLQGERLLQEEPFLQGEEK